MSRILSSSQLEAHGRLFSTVGLLKTSRLTEGHN